MKLSMKKNKMNEYQNILLNNLKNLSEDNVFAEIDKILSKGKKLGETNFSSKDPNGLAISLIDHKRNALLGTSKFDRADLLEVLLELDIDFSEHYPDLIRITVENDNIEALKLLIDKDIDVNEMENLALFLAIDNQKDEMIKMLIKNGSDPFLNESAPIALGIRRNYTKSLKTLLNELEVSSKIFRTNGIYALRGAALGGKSIENIVRFWQTKGETEYNTKFNALFNDKFTIEDLRKFKDPDTEETGFHLAVRANKLDGILKLKDFNIDDFLSKDINGKTPLGISMVKGQLNKLNKKSVWINKINCFKKFYDEIPKTYKNQVNSDELLEYLKNVDTKNKVKRLPTKKKLTFKKP